MTQTSVAGWNPNKNYVQQGIDNRRFASAKYTLLAAGPPRLGQLGGAAALIAGASAGSGELSFGSLVHPMGFIQNISIGQNKQIARFFEIGSDRSYFIPGRAVGQLSLGRVYMHGPTFLRLLYAAYSDPIVPTTIDPMITSSLVANNANPHDVIIPPGFENVFLNLQSDLFDQMFGIAVYLKDNDENILGAFYVESANIPQHGFQTDATGVVWNENVGIQYDRLVPIRMGSMVGLISARTPDTRPGWEDGYPGLKLDGAPCPSAQGHPGSPGDPVSRRCPGRRFRVCGGPLALPGGGGGGALHPLGLREQVGGLLRHSRRGCQAPPPDLRVRGLPDLPRPGRRDHRAHPGGFRLHRQPLPHQRRRLPVGDAYRGRHPSGKASGMMQTPTTAELAVYFGNEEVLREKRAGALDLAGRLAAAAILIQLLDSQRRSPLEVRHAERQVGPLIRDIEQIPHPPPRGPHLFVPTEGAFDPELRSSQYQMGFIPNVPVGMDHGMVRLASAMEKVAMGNFLGRAWGAVSGVKPSLPTLPGASMPVPAIPQRMAAGKNMLGKGSVGPEIPLSNTAMANKGLPVPKPVPATPSPAPPAPAPAVPKPAPAEGGGWGGWGGAMLLAGGAGLALGLPKATGAVLDYAEKEPVTPWGMQPYGATRLNTQVNAYGQPLPG